MAAHNAPSVYLCQKLSSNWIAILFKDKRFFMHFYNIQKSLANFIVASNNIISGQSSDVVEIFSIFFAC